MKKLTSHHSLAKKLEHWTQIGLISAEQAEAILQFEKTQKGTHKIFTSFLLLGVSVVGIGVISLIAGNWAKIPDWVKLTTDFSFLIGLALATAWARQRERGLLFEVLLFGFLLLCLASIGLISQIFQTGGELHHALLFWSLITLPASTFSRKSWIPLFWTSLFQVAVIGQVLGDDFWTMFRGKQLFLAMGLPLFSLMISTLLISRQKGPSFIKAFSFWGLGTGSLSVFAAEYLHPARSVPEADYWPMPMSIPYGLSLIMGFLIWQRQDFTRDRKILLSLLLLIYCCLFLPLPLSSQGSFIVPTLSLLVFLLAAIHFATLGHSKIFTFFVLLMGLRFFVIYLEAFRGLIMTGIGLIITGILILAVTGLWYHYRLRIEHWLRGFIK